jgi:thioesterase domain-containing protein
MIELNAMGAASRLSCHAVENVIREIWSGYFGRDVSPYDDFFDLGGDSLAMIDVVAEARERGLQVRSSVALRNPSPARLAESLTIGAAESSHVELPALYTGSPTRASGWTTQESRSMPIVRSGGAEPLYVVHSDSHMEAEQDAISAWGSERPVRGFSLRGLIPLGGTVGEVAGLLLKALRTEQAEGPYLLAGFGLGAVPAFEMARRLRDSGAQVALLALIRPPAVETGRSPGRDHLLRQRLAMLAGRFGLSGPESVEEILAKVRADGWYHDGVRPWDLPWLQPAWADLTLAVQAYDLADYDGPAILFEDVIDSVASERTWVHAIKDLEIHQFDYGIESPKAVIGDARLAQAMRKALEA